MDTTYLQRLGGCFIAGQKISTNILQVHNFAILQIILEFVK